MEVSAPIGINPLQLDLLLGGVFGAVDEFVRGGVALGVAGEVAVLAVFWLFVLWFLRCIGDARLWRRRRIVEQAGGSVRDGARRPRLPRVCASSS
jgi:hypothetical protein